MHELAPQSLVDEENSPQSSMQRPLALLAAECGSVGHVIPATRDTIELGAGQVYRDAVGALQSRVGAFTVPLAAYS